MSFMSPKRGPAAVCALIVAMTTGLLHVAASQAGENELTPDQTRAIAADKGLVIRSESDSRVFEIQRFRNGIPQYYITTNIDAADSISADECWPGGSSGHNLSGSGVTLGVWDGGGVRMSHQEFGGRVSNGDGWSSTHWHSTHVGGTMIAAGVFPGGSGYPAGQSKGMSYAANLVSYEWTDDDYEMDVAAGAGLRVSNHSYGFITGWRYDNFGPGEGWYWFGDADVSSVEDYYFGFYSYQSESWDQIAFDNPRYLFVTSAGNDRNEGPSSGTGHWYWHNDDWTWSYVTRNIDGNSGYDSVSHQAVSKNGLAVGAVDDVIGGYSSSGGVSMTSFSCWGPTDDGRIKPDICGNGYELVSASDSSDSAYALASGTSMASPNVSGALGLLIEKWRDTHSGDPDMRAATLKGLVLHTADECGSAAGPDYRYGWGLMNTPRAADVIGADDSDPLVMTEHIITNGQTIELYAITDGSSALRATICWTDPPGSEPSPSVDPTTLMLVNDLDLRIVRESPSATFNPWVLNPSNPSAAATTGDNYRDNVEQVLVSSPGSNNYTIRVTPDGSLSGGSQAFSLIITGAASLSDSQGQQYTLTVNTVGGGDVTLDPPGGVYNENTTVELTADADLGWVFDHWTGALSGSDNPETILMDGDKSVTAVFVEIDDCNNNGIDDAEDVAAGTSQDCNGNGVPDECDVADLTSEDCNFNGVPDECEVDIPNGLAGAYYDGENFAGMLRGRIDSTVNFNWETGAPLPGFGVDDFSIRWTGYVLTPGVAGTYTFYTTTDDGVRLWVNDQLIVNHWVDQAPTEWSGTIALEAGAPYSLVMEYYENGGGAVAELRWRPPGLSKVIIPSGNLLPGRDCNLNDIPDACDLASGFSDDVNGNGIPDECDPHYTLTVNVNGQGDVVEAPGGGVHLEGTSVELDAQANIGWHFDHWEGALSGSTNPDSVVMDDDKTVTAVFLPNQYTLTVNISGDGWVERDPDQASYDFGTPVDLTAHAGGGWYFDHWDGALTGSVNPETIVMDGDKIVTAVFLQYQYTLTINIVGGGTVERDPDQATYAHGQSVDLTADPDLGWAFDRWENDLTGSDNPETILMDSNKTVTAVFVEFTDCNDNGIDDAEDIAGGYSQDCNGNGVPDECDIDDGFSQDADGNGIPDECQPVAAFNANPNPAACGQSVMFDAGGSYHPDPGHSIVLYEWDFDGDLVYDASGQTVMHSYLLFDDYTVTLRVTDDNVPALTDTASTVVSVDQGNQAPDADAGGPYEIVVGDSLQLDGSGSTDPDEGCGDSIVSYAWDLDDDGQYDDATGATPTISWAALNALGMSYPGAANPIALRVTDSFGLPDTASTTLTIYDNQPVAAFTANPNPAGCGQSVTFDAGGSYHAHPGHSIVLYEWDFDGDLVYDATGVTATHAYDIYDDYVVTLRVTDDNVPALTDTTSTTVSVDQGNNAPVAGSGGPYTILEGQALLLDGSASSDPDEGCGDSIVSYEWDLDDDGQFDDATGATPTISWAVLNALGLSYPDVANPIGLRVTDSFGLPGTATSSVTISSDCNGNGTLDAQDIAECAGDPACDDCNGNGVPDWCDINDQTSEDLNENGVPDECEADCPGDLDSDLDVDLSDLAQLLAHYGTTSGAAYEDGDIDGDGDVDLSDLAALLSVYGTVCS